MATPIKKSDVAETSESYPPDAQRIIAQLARNEITEDEAIRQLEFIWMKAYNESAIRRLMRELFPSLRKK